MTMQTKTIGRMPTDHGPYDPNLAYGKKFQCSLFGCAWESLHDNNNTAPAVWDGGDTITPNLVDWKKVSGDYNAWLMNNDKPASTGTTGDYPYNGLGRIVLKKKYSENSDYANQPILEQADFDDENNNHLTNTVFVIKYDFVLTEDITLGSGCVLKFEGGSISGNQTLTGTNTSYSVDDKNKVILTDVTFAGTWLLDEIYDTSFNYTTASNFFTNLSVLSNSDILTRIYINKNYSVNAWCYAIQSNSDIVLNSTISLIPNDTENPVIWYADDMSNIKISGCGSIIGDCEDHDYTIGEYFGTFPTIDALNQATPPSTAGGQQNYAYVGSELPTNVYQYVYINDQWVWSKSKHAQGHGLRIRHCENVEVSGIHISYCVGDGLYIASTFAGQNCKNVNIHDVECSYNRRVGITVGGVEGITIRNCHVHHQGKASVGGTAPMTGIDFEDNREGAGIGNYNAFVSDCYIYDNVNEYGLEIVIVNKNITINNVICKEGLLVSSDTHEGINIQNSTFAEVGLNAGDAHPIRVSNCKLGGVSITPASLAEFSDCTIVKSIPRTSTVNSLIVLNANSTGNTDYKLTFRDCYFDTEDASIKIFDNTSRNFSDDAYLKFYNCTLRGYISDYIYSANFYGCLIEDAIGSRLILRSTTSKTLEWLNNTIILTRSNSTGFYFDESAANKKYLFAGNKFISTYANIISLIGSSTPPDATFIHNIFYSRNADADLTATVVSELASYSSIKIIHYELAT